MITNQGKFGTGLREVDLVMSWPATVTAATPVAPDRCPRRLSGTTVTYTATGIYTVVIPFTYGQGLPYSITATAQADVAAHVFQVHVVGEATQSAGVMTVVLQCVDYAGSAVAPAVNAGTRINLRITGDDCGGA